MKCQNPDSARYTLYERGHYEMNSKHYETCPQYICITALLNLYQVFLKSYLLKIAIFYLGLAGF